MTPAERVCSDLNAALEELRSTGFRLDSIYPADDPHTAVLTRGDQAVRLTRRDSDRPSGIPSFTPEFVLVRAADASAEGRAGMLYRDLIPGRLGGRYIASHITIPEGGPVADWVHYHRVTFQLIAVRRGWVRVVYEDQGEPFVMRAGDMVLQPPQIRHRVLESSAQLEVIEISCPALHETLAMSWRFRRARMPSAASVDNVSRGTWAKMGSGTRSTVAKRKPRQLTPRRRDWRRSASCVRSALCRSLSPAMTAS